MLAMWLDIIRGGQSERAHRDPHYLEAFKCLFQWMNFDILKNITQISYLTVLYYHMPPQISRLRWRITTQVTFEWLFSAVSVCPRRCKITLLDCIRMTLSNSYTSSVCFQMCPQMACIGGRQLHLHLFGFSPLCVFKCLITVRRFLTSRTVVEPQLTGQSMW